MRTQGFKFIPLGSPGRAVPWDNPLRAFARRELAGSSGTAHRAVSAVSACCCVERESEQEQKDRLNATGTAWLGERQVQPAGRAEDTGVVTGRLEVEEGEKREIKAMKLLQTDGHKAALGQWQQTCPLLFVIKSVTS